MNLAEPSGPLRRAPELKDLDLAYGLPLGFESGLDPLARTTMLSPVSAMKNVLREALRRPPCLISFSGGRDSSALLALAAQVAREEGLPLPIPATLIFPGVAAADEDEWQKLVIGHIGLDDWARFHIQDELGAIGPVASVALQRHGLLWPFNAHFHLPIIAAAAGGSVVTGFGGDELARSSESARAERVLARVRRPNRIDPLVVGLAVSPRVVRMAVHRRRAAGVVGILPWLTDAGRRRVSAAHTR